MKYTAYFFLLFLVLSCGSDDDDEVPFVCEGELPCLETNNSAYAAAYINGEVWESGVPPFGIIDEDNSVYLQDDNLLSIAFTKYESSASGGENIIQTLGMRINPEGVYEIYSLNELSGFYDAYSICYNGDSESTYYIVDEDFSNIVTLFSYDASIQQASGYFDLRVINPYCNDTLEITDGRFNCFFTIQ